MADAGVHDPHAAGDGAVVLDIGGDFGALVVSFPDALLGREIEIVPATGSEPGAAHGGFHAGEHHPADRPPHVGIVARRMGAALVATAVFGDLTGGDYRLSLVTDHHHHDAHPHDHDHHHEPGPDDDVVLAVTVVGGEVATVDWPVT